MQGKSVCQGETQRPLITIFDGESDLPITLMRSKILTGGFFLPVYDFLYRCVINLEL
jgi:hypothetical protein